MDRASGFDALSETVTELTAVIGHQIPRASPRIFGSTLEACGKVVRADPPIRSDPVIYSLLPVSGRGGMQNEALAGFLGRSTPQQHDLLDLGSLFRCVVRKLIRWLPASPQSEDV
ncbi:MAG: hypothetical protein AAF747_06480 [Planctomycetota bacterium]